MNEASRMLASGIAAGLVSGVALGGDVRNLAGVSLKFAAVLAVAVALRLSVLLPTPIEVHRLAYLASLWAIAAVAFGNRTLPGTMLICLGTVLNALVVTMNGAVMPVLPNALALAGANSLDGFHSVADSGTALPLLGDVIPLPLFTSVYSFGDVLMTVGSFVLVYRILKAK